MSATAHVRCPACECLHSVNESDVPALPGAFLSRCTACAMPFVTYRAGALFKTAAVEMTGKAVA
jgi:hypothetical protein